MHNGQRKIFSLWKKLAIIVLLGFALMAGSMYLSRQAGIFLIDNLYLSPDRVASRTQEHLDSLGRYVEQNHIAATEHELLRAWCPRNVYVQIYDGGKLLYASYWTPEELMSQASVSIGVSGDEGLPAISFADGEYKVLVTDLTYLDLYHANYYLSLLIGSGAFLLFLLAYNSTILRRILRLSRQVGQVSSGDLTLEIDGGKGQDELNQLARDVEEMRNCLQQQIESKNTALRSNSELITSLSHDLRTPLTTLMGYLDMARSGQYSSPEELERYIAMAARKAQQLKEMSDEMFRYFLVFGRQELPLEPERYDAAVLMEQMLGEPVLLLREEGFRVESVPLRGHCTLVVDAGYLRRVFDNLFSNLNKYAEPTQPICIRAFCAGGCLIVEMRNTVRRGGERKESSGIGLATCRKIAEALGGSFFTEEANGRFCARLTLPCGMECACEGEA